MTPEELWPDAFCAPDVPDMNIIGLFLDSPETLNPDLCEQIRVSENCQRALHQLEAQRIAEASPESAMADEDTVARLLEMKARIDAKRSFTWDGKEKQEPMPPPPIVSFSVPSNVSPPKIAWGQVWTVADRCQVWSGTRIVNWQIHLLQRILVVAPPFLMPWNDSVLRIVPVVDTSLCPDGYRSIGDILLEERVCGFWDDLVVHPYLEFPMSSRQLGNYVGNISAPSREKLERVLQALRKGLECPPEFEEDRKFEALRRQYAEQTLREVRWVTTTADALRLAWEQEVLN